MQCHAGGHRIDYRPLSLHDTTRLSRAACPALDGPLGQWRLEWQRELPATNHRANPVLAGGALVVVKTTLIGMWASEMRKVGLRAQVQAGPRYMTTKRRAKGEASTYFASYPTFGQPTTTNLMNFFFSGNRQLPDGAR